ncbi:MAG: phosphoribosylformylglycinamidine cyclo-ligase [Candidatus Omnitrophota bacterium]
MRKMTYKRSGVDIERADKFIKDIMPLVRKTKRYEVLSDIGSFGGFFSFLKRSFKHPVLVSSSDGVGTKIKIAILANVHNTVGIDLVAMNVNDILCSGAEPLFFLDYIACSKLKAKTLRSIMEGIVKGCQYAGCALIGGETAQMPDMYRKGDYDLAGFCVGVVEKNKIINGSKTEIGDVVIGLESSGLHSNGFSLVRRVFSKSELKRFSSQLLKPTRIYSKPVLKLINEFNAKNKFDIRGIAHITGGAFFNKACRIIPTGKTIYIKKGSWPIPKIFKVIEKKGRISEREMFHAFNMGIGMILVVDRKIADDILRKLKALGLNSWVIGEVINGKKKVKII